jgi:hypothetical protein
MMDSHLDDLAERSSMGRSARVFLVVLTTALVLASLRVSWAQAAVERAPVVTAPPTISGTVKAGETVTASQGSWTDEPTSFAYAWDLCRSSTCLPEQQSATLTFLVKPEDVGWKLQVRVTAINSFGSTTVSSAPVEVERSWRWQVEPPRTEVISWSALPPATPWSSTKMLTLSVSTGFCVGQEEPSISDVEVKERTPSKKLPYPSAVIKSSLLWPAPLKVVGTVNRGEPFPACAGIGLGLSKEIELKRSVADLFLYDGSYSPPRLILRPDRELHWKVDGEPTAKSITIEAPFTACTVAQKSVVTHVVERRGRAVITVYQEMNGPREEKGCLKLRGSYRTKIELKHPSGRLRILDGSFDPPKPEVTP